MGYPKEFFDISLYFAKKVADISWQSFATALLHYTNLYIRFGLGRDFNSAHPIWQEYLTGLYQADDQGEWTYHFYLQQPVACPSISFDWPFGCFSYTILDSNRVRLHFHNNESAEHSPLSRNRMEQRIAELTAMFAHLKGKLGSSAVIIGASWLYNLQAYRRMFPPAYLATAEASENDFAYLPLWGQFIDHRGQIKERLIQEFLERLGRQQQLEGISQCFPFQVLHLESTIREFCAFYGV